jgi:drug/metabolite transporter (DMT)-like permease
VAAGLTGVMIAGYTFVDAQGVRHSEDPFDFIVWSFFLDGLPMTAVALAVRGRGALSFLVAWGWRGIGGGLMATLGYGIVLFAMSQSPMASVAALRETSVIFAAWIGTRLLGEPFGGLRLLAAAGVACGVILLQ